MGPAVNWPWRRKRRERRCPSEEAQHAAQESERAYKDARVQRAIAEDTHIRATETAARLDATRRRNHFGEAVAKSMRRA
jgi:hypothetical protein